MTHPVKMVKAFLDVGFYESMCWARAGWYKMSLVQMMSLCLLVLSTKSVSKLPLIRPAFIDRASKAHIDAIFKGPTFLDRIDHVGSILLELFRSIEQSQIQGSSTGIPKLIPINTSNRYLVIKYMFFCSIQSEDLSITLQGRLFMALFQG